MCYDDKARAPLPPGELQPAQGEDQVLTAADGNQFAAYLARPEAPARAQMLILPDVRGLHPFYKDLALRLAQKGIAAVALDYFGRTAGVATRDDSFEFMPHVQRLTGPTVAADAQAALAALRAQAGESQRQFIMGFCLGGALTFLCGTQDFGQSGIIAFYAGLTRDLGGGTVLERAPQVRVPALGLFGGNDPGIPAEAVQSLDEQLDKAGVAHEVVTYPGAPHSFFDRRATEYAQESADAWERLLAFVDQHA
jgi:carboxymethylenebutenolidase